jgi:hypothetical protein
MRSNLGGSPNNLVSCSSFPACWTSSTVAPLIRCGQSFLLEVCTGRNFRILPDPARGQFGPTRPEPECIVCATRPDPNPNIICAARPDPNPNIICHTRPEPEYYSCYLTGPEPEYYLCYPAIGTVKISSSNYENPRENQVGEICSANPYEPNFPSSCRMTLSK